MFCTKCGKENQDNARFCAFCGAELRHGDAEVNVPGKNAGGMKGAAILIAAIAVLFLAVAAAVVFLVVLPMVKERRYNESISEAHRYVEEENYEKAEDSYLKAVRLRPEKEEPYVELAEIYNAGEKHEKAVEILEQGVKETKSSIVEQKYNMYTYVDEVLVPQEGECQEGDYTCSYVKTSDYVGLEPVHSQTGVVNYRIRDFDNDGVEELLVLTLKNDIPYGSYPGRSVNAVYLQMYETEGPEVVLKDEFTELAPVLGMGDEERCGLFLQEDNGSTYICGGVRHLVYMYADGTSYNSFVLGYRDGTFVKLAGTDGLLAGSEFSGEKDDAYEMADFLDSIGLPKEAAEIRESWIRSFSYIDDCEEILLLTAGENDGSGNSLEFSRSMDPAALGKVNLTLRTHRDGEKKEDIGAHPSTENNSDAGESHQDSKVVTAEMYRNVYGAVLDQGYRDTAAGNMPYYTYSVYDIDKDGVKELIILSGTCEADYMFQVYTIENGSSVLLGEIPGGHSALYADEEGGAQPYIIQLQAHMGYEVISHISISDGTLISEKVSEREVPADGQYYSNAYPLEMASVTDRSLLVQENSVDKQNDAETTQEQTVYTEGPVEITGTLGVVEWEHPNGSMISAYVLQLDEPADVKLKVWGEPTEIKGCEMIQILNMEKGIDNALVGKHVKVQGNLEQSPLTAYYLDTYLIQDAVVQEG